MLPLWPALRHQHNRPALVSGELSHRGLHVPPFELLQLLEHRCATSGACAQLQRLRVGHRLNTVGGRGPSIRCLGSKEPRFRARAPRASACRRAASIHHASKRHSAACMASRARADATAVTPPPLEIASRCRVDRACRLAGPTRRTAASGAASGGFLQDSRGNRREASLRASKGHLLITCNHRASFHPLKLPLIVWPVARVRCRQRGAA
jgi:hypothetical protein